MIGMMFSTNPCAWCVRLGYRRCPQPLSEWCRFERRLEDMAYAINRFLLEEWGKA